MSDRKRNLNKEIIALFSGQSSQVTTPKIYIELTGGHSLALVLNQSVFWSNKSVCENGFFHKTYEEWYEEINIPERTLRRRFNTLEKCGWITTKVKKVNGKNTKHVKPHMDKIIESISIMLNIESPSRPLWPSGSKDEQKPCTKTTPTGHFGRSEPANLADSSIYTEDNLQKKLTNCEVSSSSFVFSQTTDKNILNQKLSQDTRTDDEFLAMALDHVENHSDKIKAPNRLQRAGALVKLLAKHKQDNVIFYVSGTGPKNFTEKSSDSNTTASIVKTPEEDDFRNHANNAKGFEWVGSWIKEQYTNSRLPQFCFQQFAVKQKGYEWVGKWMQHKESQRQQA